MTAPTRDLVDVATIYASTRHLAHPRHLDRVSADTAGRAGRALCGSIGWDQTGRDWLVGTPAYRVDIAALQLCATCAKAAP